MAVGSLNIDSGLKSGMTSTKQGPFIIVLVEGSSTQRKSFWRLKYSINKLTIPITFVSYSLGIFSLLQ